jgi:aspartate aminotransferase
MEAGFECVKPQGAFYMFPKSPIPDELEFVRALQQEERIMVVPGRGLGEKVISGSHTAYQWKRYSRRVRAS